VKQWESQLVAIFLELLMLGYAKIPFWRSKPNKVEGTQKKREKCVGKTKNIHAFI